MPLIKPPFYSITRIGRYGSSFVPGMSRRASRLALLGVSSLALIVAAPQLASARPIGGFGGGGSSAPNVTTDAALAAQQQAVAAAQRAQSSLTRATQAIQAMQAAQNAAQALARSAPNAVPNGLGPGGLNPVANPVPAAQDTTGLQTWEGAQLPTQSSNANGGVDVTIRQTQSSAILSWQSFNVGSKTTLTFDQQGNASWVALNRVVGSIAPSQILGTIKADGTVLVINQNGIIFGGGAQINVGSLIATTLEIGQALNTATGGAPTIFSLAQRDQQFLATGLLALGSTSGATILSPAPGQVTVSGVAHYQSSGSIVVQNGAEITSAPNGYILLASPVIENAGYLSATDGQVLLLAADGVSVQAATGAAGSLVPGIRGLLVAPDPNITTTSLKSVVNDATGIIESARGSIFLGSAGTTVNEGGLFASTSVSRNGAIDVSGTNITLAPGSIIAITPDNDGETIPQDPTSIADFKPSQITIGNLNNRLTNSNSDTSAQIDIASNTLTYAPSGNITIGTQPGPNTFTGQSSASRIFVDSGAIIDASGLKNVEIPASRNQLQISPLTANDLADDPLNAFVLNGATVYVDPRLSGVRADGVAWIGSPLIDAASYYQQVGVSVLELMTKGGNVSLGVASFNGTGGATAAPNVIVKSGAVIDISGGWVTYQAGTVHTTQLIDASGRIIDIGNADPNDVYVGIYNGFTVDHTHWGITETYASGLRSGTYTQTEYTEGRDAGSLTVEGSAAAIDGTVYAQAFPGVRQLSDSVIGTGTSSVYGDERPVQAAPSQLPAGGFLFIQAQATAAGGSHGTPGGGDIVVQSASDYQALPNALGYGQTLQVAANGAVIVSSRDPASFLSASQLGAINLSDAFLSDSGFGQVSLATTGAVTVASNAAVTLPPGGIFNVLAGHRITVDGTVSAPGGQIALATFDGQGSVFSTTAATVGDYDVVVDGVLSTRGRWVNDFNLAADSIAGSAWLDGGSITLYAAPRISTVTSVQSGATPATATDLSGSVYINTGSLVDVSGGGRVDQKGNLNLTARGGNLSIYDDTGYFQVSSSPNEVTAGAIDGFRITGLTDNSQPYVPVNPGQINAKVLIDPNSIKAQGFGGGGTFTLTTPEFAFSDDTSSDASANATRLPLSFFSTAGFANYNITSYKTALFNNPFNNNLGGTDAVLATQTLTIGAGQNLNLTQAMLPSVLNPGQFAALLGLATGGDVFSVVAPAVPANAWDRQAASLTLGGLLELDVAQGGRITGDAGAALTVSKLLNEGTIRLPGGSITQQEILPALYTAANVQGIRSLSDILNPTAAGGSTFAETAASKIAGSTNAQVLRKDLIYFVGALDGNQGIVLAPGSVTDLSGTSIRDPYAMAGGSSIVTGRMVDGGSISTLPSAALNGQNLYQYQPQLPSVYQALATNIAGSANGFTTNGLSVIQVGDDFTLKPGSTLNLSGASDTYDQLA